MLAFVAKKEVASMFKLMVQSVILILALSGNVARSAVVLQYHHVADDTPASTSVSPDQFSAHLDALARLKFRVIPLDQLFEEVKAGLDPREKVAAITFDDGYADIDQTALPLLEKRGWRASVFVATDEIGAGSGMLTARQLNDMSARGHLVLNHSASHSYMIRRQRGESENEWLSRARLEIDGAQSELERIIGKAPPKIFAYPYGEQNKALQNLLLELGYIALGQQTGALGADVNWQLVPRVSINRHYSDWVALEEKVLALPMPVKNVMPADGVTEKSEESLVLTLPQDWRNKSLNCFASNKSVRPRVVVNESFKTVDVVLNTPVPRGRSRVNCTAPAGDGRFYWYSWMWIRQDSN